MPEPILEQPNADDVVLDHALRPKAWDQFVGQDQVKRGLQIVLEASKKQNRAVDHILFSGPSGVGKTTLAHLIAHELGAKMTTTSGPTIQKTGDAAALLSNLEEGEVLFIDEVHRLNKQIEEIMYPAMESRVLHLMIGKGVSSRSLELKLPRFTLIAATTRPSLLTGPFRNRFGALYHLDYYEPKDISEILKRSSAILGITVDQNALDALARASRATPRIANRLLKRTWDLAVVRDTNRITKPLVEESLDILGIDKDGLETIDRAYLHMLVRKFNGGPVGIQTLAAALNEEQETLENVCEPYLLRLGLLERTARGRMATKQAYEYFS